MSYGCVVVLFPDPSHDQIHEGSGYGTNGWEQSGGDVLTWTATSGLTAAYEDCEAALWPSWSWTHSVDFLTTLYTQQYEG